MAATATPSDPLAAAGKMTFENKCLACHALGQGRKVGPDLAGVTQRRRDEWIERWLASPETMLAHDDTAKALLAVYKLPMPNQALAPAGRRELIAYFHWYDSAAHRHDEAR
jgi:nitrite reductase (NO-forming)